MLKIFSRREETPALMNRVDLFATLTDPSIEESAKLELVAGQIRAAGESGQTPWAMQLATLRRDLIYRWEIAHNAPGSN